jgi:hypothetical protein
MKWQSFCPFKKPYMEVAVLTTNSEHTSIDHELVLGRQARQQSNHLSTTYIDIDPYFQQLEQTTQTSIFSLGIRKRTRRQ